MNRLKLQIQFFSSTNETTHYQLSQYIGSDKPTYLIDYNGDMSKIDAGIYSAESKATINTSAIGDLSTLTTTASTDLVSAINEVDAHADTNATNISNNTTDIATNTSAIGTIANLTTTDKSNLVSAINEVKSAVPTVSDSILNSNSNSSTDTYSCDYANKNFRGVTLWTNSSPTSSFANQTLQIDLSTYSAIEIIYYTEIESSAWQYEMTTGKLPIINNTNILLGGYIMTVGAEQAPQFFGRRAIVTTTGVEFKAGKNYNGSQFSDRNQSGVPLYIIGYKNN